MTDTRRHLIQVRVSEEEKSRIGFLAQAAGVKASEWIRARALEQALGVETAPPAEDGQRAARSATPSVPARAPVRHHCPSSGCSFSAPSVNAKCPRHGYKVR